MRAIINLTTGVSESSLPPLLRKGAGNMEATGLVTVRVCGNGSMQTEYRTPALLLAVDSTVKFLGNENLSLATPIGVELPIENVHKRAEFSVKGRR